MSCGCGRSPDFCRGWHSLSEEEWQRELAEWQTRNEYDKPTANKHTVEVTEVHHYTDKLFRFETTKPKGYLFKAGEFVMIGLGDKTKRAYSITSSPTDNFLEFYSIKVPDGKLTSRFFPTEYITSSPIKSIRPYNPVGGRPKGLDSNASIFSIERFFFLASFPS